MPETPNFKRHIIFSGRTTSERYTSPQTGRNRLEIAQRNPSEHGRMLREKLEAVVLQRQQEGQEPLRTNVIREDAIYVEFISDINYELAFDSFEDNRSGDFHLLKCDKVGERFRALVELNSRGVSKFIKKIEDYSSRLRETVEGRPPVPPNYLLLSNISDIRLATLKEFWSEFTVEFPGPGQEVWWEVWLRRSDFESDTGEDRKVVEQLSAVGLVIGLRRLLLPEHIVRLVKATREQLSNSLLLLDNLAELRKPKETADFFTDLTSFEQREWVEDLLRRIDRGSEADTIAICILDTGVNNGHPLINPFLPNASMDSVNPAWGNQDGHPNGHGTQMAGLALFGDLTDALSTTESIQIYHRIESIKLFNASDQHAPDIFGDVTNECVARAEVLTPGRKRVYCLAITAKDNHDQGRPSSWSTAVDKLSFGQSGIGDKNLIVVSGGNVEIEDPAEFPNKNKTEFVHDPAQAYNVLTIGGYTEKDSIDTTQFPGASAMAARGTLAPCSSTSCLISRQWPIKPDILMEAGNYANQRGTKVVPDSLQLLSTKKEFRVSQFTSFGDTSAATALSANFCASIRTKYRDLWPESIRGIAVHSANWTTAMLGGRQIDSLGAEEKNQFLRTYGYGVPNLSKALNSLNNSLTLIAERIIQPFFDDGGQIKTNEIHIFDLPWPRDVLTALAESSVKLTITLSYFVEPNPGNRYFTSKFTYQSHGLRFKMKRPEESLAEFRIRINRAARPDEEENSTNTNQDNWQIGEKVRNVGSIHKDIWVGTAAQLASMNSVAVFPVNGWWRLRKKLNRFNSQARYSLIITIESPETTVDLYTPVETLVTVQV